MGKKSSSNNSDNPSNHGRKALRPSSMRGLSSSRTNMLGERDACFPSGLLDDDKTARHSSATRIVETLVPGYIWAISNFLSERECQNWVHHVETSVTLEHLKQRGTRYMAARECCRAHRNDPDMADRLFQRLQACLPHRHDDDCHNDETSSLPPSNPLSCNPNLRLYKYLPGHSFGPHVDESVVVGTGRTKLTVLIYLSNCHGGETRFEVPPNIVVRSGGRALPENIAFAPKAGSLLLHLHGDDCLLHQGDPVIRGTKYVLRSDVVY